MDAIRIAIVTVSDGVVAGTRTDTSGAAIAEWAKQRGHTVSHSAVVRDRTSDIVACLVHCCDVLSADVVLTTGGTGLTEQDVTPEATRAVIARAVPGIAEAMRAAGANSTPAAWISRGVAGTRGSTLVVNLPGSTSGVRDGLAVLDTVLDHAVQLLRGIETSRHPAGNA